MSRSDEDRLLDIVAAIEAIGRHVERGSLDEIEHDPTAIFWG